MRRRGPDMPENQNRQAGDRSQGVDSDIAPFEPNVIADYFRGLQHGC